MAKRRKKTNAKSSAQRPRANTKAACKVDNPHDKRFKQLFAHKESFLSLLHESVKEDWVKNLDEDSLKKSEKSFILQDFSEIEADIVYEASLDGRKVIFYILFEIQSYVDYRMPYRLLLYIVEILRDYFNHSDIKERDNKDFKFPVIFPIVFYSGSRTWTVPLSLNRMFDGYERFGSNVLNVEYMLVDAKGFRENDLKDFSSRLLASVLLMEKSKNDVEFYDNIRKSLSDIKDFDAEEMRIFNLFIKIMDIAYDKNRSKEIQKILVDENKGRSGEADRMLCDLVENAKKEKEQLLAEGRLEGELKGKAEGKLEEKLEVAKSMLREKLSTDLIIRVTNLTKEDIEAIVV